MFHTIMFFLTLSVSSPAANVPKCETYAPRTDGISVTVCDGSVTRMCDASGNCIDRR